MCTPSPPPPPDFAAAAQETAAGNLESARLAARANRVDQFTPYGSLTYTDLGNDRWRQDMNLTPQAQQALNQQLDLNQKYGEVANIGFDRARSIFENPQLNTGNLPQINALNAASLPNAPINAGQTAQQAILSRLNPQLSQQEESLRTRLANQGITLGSDAYNREMMAQGQRANDLTMQAALQGINLDQAARQQGLQEQLAFANNAADTRARMLQEQAYLQDRPLNLINALRTGNQVQAPQFQQFAQQATTAGPDLLNAANAQYGAAVDATNARNAQSSGMMGGLLGLGLGAAGLPVAGGGSLGGNFLGGLFR